jgi:hypothetical protein
MNIKLGWKGLPGTKTLAYYRNPEITAVKCFMIQALSLMFENKLGSQLTTLYFLCNLQMGPISLGVSLWQAFPHERNVTLQLIGQIREIRRT